LIRIREEITVFFHGRCIKSRKSDGNTKIRFLEKGGEGVYYCAVCFDPNYRTRDAATVLSTSETSLSSTVNKRLNIDRTAGLGSFPVQSPEEKDKNKFKLGPKMYVLQCTLYVCRNVHLGFFKNIIKNVSKIFQTLPG
jgi:hypothetical protein